MTEILQEHDDPSPAPRTEPWGPSPRLMGYVYGVDAWDEDRGCWFTLGGNMSETVYSHAARSLRGEGFEQAAIDYGEMYGAVFYMLDEELPFSVVYTQI